MAQAIAADPSSRLHMPCRGPGTNSATSKNVNKKPRRRWISPPTCLAWSECRWRPITTKVCPITRRRLSIYRVLFELFPDSVAYGLQLAWAQNGAAYGNQAMETISRLRRLPSPASNDPRVDIVESRVPPLGTRKPLSCCTMPSKNLPPNERSWHNSKIPGFAIGGCVPDFHGLTAFIVICDH